MADLHTKIGLEIHVQLKTKSKMFCSCDNNAQGKAPNSVVCPVCLGFPGSLPVANEQAIEWTIKTGLALNCEIPKIAKFDRKHYFYPDLPKGYQISQYDEPFCLGGYVEVDGQKINLTRIHLEEDAGKLTHKGDKSLVDLNRAGTPLMEIVTEPDITSPKQAGDFLRKLQKIVRDVVEVSDADMEKGHMRCDGNISVNDGDKMSEIVELKNINSFKFLEKALTIEEARLKEEYPAWPEKLKKVTRGYNSENNTTYPQRTKEEAADYRYFPEPDLPPFDTTKFDHEKLKSEVSKTAEEKLDELIFFGIAEADAKVFISNHAKDEILRKLMTGVDKSHYGFLGKAIVNNYFPFDFSENDWARIDDYAKAIKLAADENMPKALFGLLVKNIHNDKSFDEARKEVDTNDSSESLEEVIDNIIKANSREVERYRAGETQLLGFFMGQIMRETKGKANPQEITKILKGKL